MVSRKLVLRNRHTYRLTSKSDYNNLFGTSSMLKGYKNIGIRTKAMRMEKEYLSAVEAISIRGLDEEMRVGIADNVFPQMEEDMKKMLDDMESGGGVFGRPALISKNKDSVYNNFEYTKKGRAKKSKAPIVFKNTSLHVSPLIYGVQPKTGPWFVGDWVKKMAQTGKLKSNSLLQRKNKTASRLSKQSVQRYPEFIMGIGETKRRENNLINKQFTKAKNAVSRIEKKSRYKGKVKDLKKAKKSLERLQKNVGFQDKRKGKDTAERKFTALEKGNSKRDFWSPNVRKYFGNLPSLPPTVMRPASSSGGSEVAKELTDSILRRIKKNMNDVKKERNKRKNI